MKKRAFLILALISIVVMLAGTAAAPMASRSISFLDARFVPGKGVVFLFETTGVFTKSDMNTAFAYADGKSLDIDCHMKDNSQIACTVALINQYAGQSVVVGLIGQGFWATVPGTVTCYGFSYGLYQMDSDIFRAYNDSLTKKEVMSWYVPDYVTNLNYCVKYKWDGYPASVFPVSPQ